MKEIRALEAAARIERKVLGEARRIMAADSSKPSAVSMTPKTTAATLQTLVVGMTPQLAIVFSLVAISAFALSRLVKERDAPKVGFLGQSVAMVGACAASVVVVGLAPAEVISRSIQSWVLTVSIIAVPVVLASYVAWPWLSRRKFRFSLRAMLLAITVLCVLLGVVSITRPNLESFTRLPFDLSVPALGSQQLDVRSLEAVIRPLGTWMWVAFQWASYFGQYLMVAIWGLLVAVLLRRKLNRTSAIAGGTPQSIRRFLAGWCRSLSGPAITLSGLTLIAYLALAPGSIELVEEEYQRNMDFARNPGAHWSRVDAAVQSVRSDQVKLKVLRAAVHAEMSTE
jgi:hypothetical protein